MQMTSIVSEKYIPGVSDEKSMLERTRKQFRKLRWVGPKEEALRVLAWGKYSWRLYRSVATRGLVLWSAVSPNRRVSLKSILINWAAMVALWAPVYLALLDHLGPKSVAQSESLQWVLVVIGFMGIGGVLYACWKDTRDPAWRAAHRLPHIRSGAAGR
jgi:hypothetical protein